MHATTEPPVRDRARLLQAYFEEVEELRQAADTQSLEAVRRLSALQDEYIAAVPRVALARCPFTHAPLVHSIDSNGLDGLWWRYENPVRPVDEATPPTFVALTGAVRLSSDLEMFPFLCKPGPEAPYVIPRLLDDPTMRAVVAHVRIGPHDGFAVSYFADRPAAGRRLFNTWGSSEYATDAGWDSLSEDAEPLDFDLAPWIERGRLAWIAPNDPALRLHDDLERCPFLNLPGRRTWVRVQRGRVWEGPPTRR